MGDPGGGGELLFSGLRTTHTKSHSSGAPDWGRRPLCCEAPRAKMEYGRGQARTPTPDPSHKGTGKGWAYLRLWDWQVGHCPYNLGCLPTHNTLSLALSRQGPR